jgi:DAK2 domain fusion protein YloV
MGRFADALRAHRDELNSLNVFPVPDGDTGTNMLLTQEAVTRALEANGHRGLPEVGDAIARASLMGARGNSGVILSQVLRGLVSVLCVGEPPGPAQMAEALEEAAREAYRAVARPREGTVLTVLEEAARGARAACDAGGGLAEVAAEALRAGGEALRRTPQLLPELGRAGVVDAGGRGALLLFDALVSVLSGTPMSVGVGPLGPVGQGAGVSGTAPETLTFSHEVMYLLEAADDSVAGLREALDEIGDSVVIVGGGGLYNVHVHTNETDAAVGVGRGAGVPREIRITDLTEAVRDRCLAGQARAVHVAEGRVAMVAVTEGGGLEDLFRSLGAVVVAGGPGRNPSVEELHAAILATSAEAIVVLPNHPNVVPAAERAAAEAGPDVHVLPTRSAPQGLAAAAVFNALGEPAGVREEMAAAAAGCASGELAVAERRAETPAGPVRPGEWVALTEGEIVGVGDDPAVLAADLVRRLRRPGHEVLMLLTGVGASSEQAEEVRSAIHAAANGLEIESHRGDQPRYPYLIGLE